MPSQLIRVLPETELFITQPVYCDRPGDRVLTYFYAAIVASTTARPKKLQKGRNVVKAGLQLIEA